MNTVKLLKAYAHQASSENDNSVPTHIVHSVMVANNRILAAAVIENGGEIIISPGSIHEMLTTTTHVVAVANDDGSLTVTLALKDEVLATPHLMAL